MIKWYSVSEGVSGFSYYPLLEISVGIFLLIMAFLVPILFLAYNGINIGQWDELLFCLVFLILFAGLGHSLTFQSLRAQYGEEQFSFFQSLRKPDFSLTLDKLSWTGIQTREQEQGNETFIILYLKTNKENVEFYRSVNRKEIRKITEALDKLKKLSEEKFNETSTAGN